MSDDVSQRTDFSRAWTTIYRAGILILLGTLATVQITGEGGPEWLSVGVWLAITGTIGPIAEDALMMLWEGITEYRGESA